MSVKETATQVESSINRVAKIIASIMLFSSLIGVFATQVLGPGLLPVIQGYLGVPEIIKRLERIESTMPPPKVVEWDMERAIQIKPCYAGSICTVILHGSRTKYGASCGKPDRTIPFLLVGNEPPLRLSYAPDWSPIELARQPTSFEVRIEIPRYVPEGVTRFYTQVRYPNCPGENGTVERITPPFPLLIESDLGSLK